MNTCHYYDNKNWQVFILLTRNLEWKSFIYLVYSFTVLGVHNEKKENKACIYFVGCIVFIYAWNNKLWIEWMDTIKGRKKLHANPTTTSTLTSFSFPTIHTTESCSESISQVPRATSNFPPKLFTLTREHCFA